MHTLTTKLLGTLALAFAGQALAQSPAAPANASTGFFRPSADPAITAFRPLPDPSAPARPAAPAMPVQPAADPDQERRVQAEAESRARIEAQMDRIEAIHARSVAQAQADTRLPPIASPLDGTARPMSPLDGTAPLVSPISR